MNTYLPNDKYSIACHSHGSRSFWRHATICCLGTVLLSALLGSAAASASDKKVLFREASLALTAANEAQANLLAPNGYSNGSEYFQKAEILFAKKRPIDKTKKALADATAALNKAAKDAELAQITFSSALKARNDAKGVDAQRMASEAWKTAEEQLMQAATRLEAGNLKKAENIAADAESNYRSAELSAIKSSYLDEARELIASAKKQKVARYAPKTFAKAQDLLQKAGKELTDNRYDIDYPRSLARQARYEAKHAIYLAGMVRQLDKGKISTEEFLLDAEEPLIKIATALDMIVSFDQGVEPVTQGLVANVESLRADSYELGERKKELARLEQEMMMLEQRMGVQSQRLAEQEAQKAKLLQVSTLLPQDEAIVMTQGQNVLVRAVGLSFDPGSSQIASRNFALLRKLKDVIDLYSGYDVIIEGHTDSFGSDRINLDLSLSRAESVTEYLRANLANNRAIKAVGYGETRPIANNETQQGRSKNRRIDLLLKPTR